MGAAPVRMATPLCYSIRQVSTTPSKKAQVAKKAAKAAGPAKEKTKTPPGTATSQPKKPSAQAAAAVAPKQPVPVAKVPAAAKRAMKTQASKSTDTATSAKEANPAKKSTKATTASTTGAPAPAASQPSLATNKRGSNPNVSATSTTDGAKPKVDPSSPEYKQAARKWVATMIALPILIVTSYFLYNRLVLGNNPSLEPYRSKPRTVPAAKDA